MCLRKIRLLGDARVEYSRPAVSPPTRGEKAAETYDLLIKAALQGQSSAIEAISRSAVQLARGIRILLSGLAPRDVVIAV